MKAHKEHERVRREAFRRAINQQQEEFLRNLNVRRPYAVRDRKGERSDSTGDWIFRKDAYKQWLTRPSPQVLTILGPPGQGKSVLAKHILNTLQQNDPTSLVLEVFCEDSPNHNTSLSIIQSLLYQLLKPRRRLFKHVGAFLTEPGDTDRMSSFAMLWRLFIRIMRDEECPESYCIIDGLDECLKESQQEFFSAVYRDLVPKTEKTLGTKERCRVLLTSRDTVTANDFGVKSLLLHIESDDVKPDISKYLGQELARLNTSLPTADLTQIISMALTKWSDGMFLWVSLVINELSRVDRQLTWEDIEESWKALPAPLNGLYNRVLLRIPTNERVEAQKILEVLLFAQTTMDPDEFRIAMTENLGNFSSHQDLLHKCDPFAMYKAKAICGSLVRITSENEIQLCHHSVRQYLLDPSDKEGELSLFNFDRKRGHLKMVKQCMSYLLRDDVELPGMGANGTIPSSRFPFLWYALISWALHLRQADDAAYLVLDVVRDFYNSGRLRRCVELWSYFSPLSVYDLPKDQDLVLHCLVYFGHIHILRNSKIGTACLVQDPANGILDISSHIDATDLYGESPLFVAMDCLDDDSRVDLVKTLLDLGANPNLKREDGLKPLHKAVVSENAHEIVKILIPLTVPVDSEDDRQTTPLLYAASAGNLDNVALLCAANADVNHQDLLGNSALHLAAVKNHSSVLRKLLSYNVKQLRDKIGCTPLHDASRTGHSEICQILLNNDADIEAKFDGGWTALHVAATEGHADVVRALTKREAKVSTRNDYGDTPLHSAAENGHYEVVTILLDSKAEADAPNLNTGETPLHSAALLEKNPVIDAVTASSSTPLSLAASNGHTKTVQLLLDRRADVHFVSVQHPPMLLMAISNGHDEVAKLLIQHGARTDYVWKAHFSPMYVAAWKDRIAIAEMLFARNVVIIGKSDDSAAILNYFASNGREEAVRKCVAAGMKVTCASETGWTPLHNAAACGHDGLIRFLLSKGADPKGQTAKGFTPLHAACYNGHVNAAKVLLESGAKSDTLAENGSTPLHSAAANGSVELVRLLKGYGVAVSIADKIGYQAMHLAAISGSLNLIEELLVWGAHADCESTEKITPIHVAAEKGHHAIVRRLHTAGARIDAASTTGKTPILSAVSSCNLETFKYLLQQGANPNAQESAAVGQTALHSMAPHGDIAICELHLEHGANPNAVSCWLLTPMHLAAQKKHIDLVQKMFTKGGRLDTFDGFGRTPYFWLERAGCDMKTSFPGIDTPEDLNENEWKAHLKSFILLLKHHLIEVDSGNKAFGIDHIGRCFAMLGDFEAASIALEHSIVVKDDKDVHTAYCDACHVFDNDIEGKRFVCSQCPNSDLCEKHYDEYVAGDLKLDFCKNHLHVKVPRDIRESLEPGEVNDSGQTFDEWLNAIEFT